MQSSEEHDASEYSHKSSRMKSNERAWKANDFSLQDVKMKKKIEKSARYVIRGGMSR